MTCAHVLGLIDAGPFADYPRAHLEAAWQHARQCATCGRALEAAAAMTRDLTALPEPVLPPDLSAVVMNRIAMIERAQDRIVAAEHRETIRAPRWSAWVTTLGGLAAGLAVAVAALPGGAAMTPSLSAMPAAARTLLLASGLLLYASGLFAPISNRNRG